MLRKEEDRRGRRGRGGGGGSGSGRRRGEGGGKIRAMNVSGLVLLCGFGGGEEES